MTKITKAIIAAAGFGTRFLPQTKAMPKEMLPLIDKPIIQYVVEELVEAGIKDIIIVSGYSKRAIEDHFDLPNQDLISNLKAGGSKKEPLLHEVEAIGNLANFIYVRQKGPYGNATPVASAIHLLGNEPFIYTYADDFFSAKPGRTRQLIDVYEKYGGAVLACKRVVEDDEYTRYGIVAGKQVKEGLLEVTQIVEKPGKQAAPSNLASVSGYLLTPEICQYLESAVRPDEAEGEFNIQPIMQQMINDGVPFYAHEIQGGAYHDTGNKLDYLKTVVDFALKREDIKEDFYNHLKTLVEHKEKKTR
jgi:UTP--glucose-1-phosphate uridylyltransferase